MMIPKIILASQSPRRRELLHLAEIPFEVIVANTDESYPTNLSNPDIAIHIATQKAVTVASNYNEAVILAADTIVICKNQIIGKPINEAHAIEILQTLSANTHQVITGVCIIQQKTTVTFAETTTVYFNTLTDEQIKFYVQKYKPYDKAGAYAIQEWIGAVGIKKIEGDFYNVMGLPISRVVQELSKLNIK